MGEHLQAGIEKGIGEARLLGRALGHIGLDLVLAIGFFLAMALALGLAFETYVQHVGLSERISLLSVDGTSGYTVDIHADPFGTGLWVTLMLFTTLVPTIVHLGMVVGAILPAVMLPDKKRLQLAADLEALGEEPPAAGPERAHWQRVIWEAARFEVAYKWRMLAGSVLTLLAIARLPGFGRWRKTLLPRRLGPRLRQAGINLARWLWGVG